MAIDICFRKIREEIGRARRRRKLQEKIAIRRKAEKLEIDLPPVIPLPWDYRPREPSIPIAIPVTPPRNRWIRRNAHNIQNGYNRPVR